MLYKKITGIYMIKCKINNKVYIGQSKNIKKRFSDHRSALNRNNHYNDLLQNDWNKYGQCSFEFSLIKECEEYELNKLENKYINEYKSYDKKSGYNITLGKDIDGAEIYTEEMRRRNSEGHVGHEVPEETKKKIGEANRGKKRTEEQKRAMSENRKGEKHPNYGKPMSEEQKKKISEAHKGKKMPEGFGKIISEINSGSNHPKALKLICIYPDGTQTDIMTQKELAEYLRINRATVDKILKSGQPYNPRRGNVKHLKGIKIIKVEEGLF